jgi:ABC-type transporter Mla maintaining outer membrane lipid asymmetry ATPase subunit MlaF
MPRRVNDQEPPAAVSTVGLRKSYGDKPVLDGIDLRIPTGAVFALLGPNGAGKTIGAVALYTWTVAFRAPRRLSTVRRISSFRAGTSTDIRTSSGIRFCSISARTLTACDRL